jgi:hypothetical protein
MEGWIKIHRQIKEHWIWNDAMYLKAWLGILLSVNHEDKKTLIQGELIECKRGQSILSLAGWSKCFGDKWTIQRVRTFFELLKKDQMISAEGLRKTTRITVCNYDSYQIIQQTKNKQTTSRQQADNNEITTNKNKEEGIKNEKKYIDDVELNVLFEKFLEMRRMIKKPASDYAIQLLIAKLNKISQNKEQQKAIIEQSIIKNYQGLFPVVNNNKPQMP